MMCYTADVYDFRRSCMKNKLLIILTVMLLAVCMPISADAELKPVADPWDDPNNLITDGAVYKTYNADGYVVAWETPECDVNGKYMLIENGTQLKVDNRVSYMGDIPWGSVSIPTEDGEENFTGWVLMSDMLDADGNPAAVAPVSIPEHPMIADPKPEPTPAPTDEPEATPEPTVPSRPEQAININNTYNNAIVYTSIAIAAVALAFAVLVLVKHKALNKKGE